MVLTNHTDFLGDNVYTFFKHGLEYPSINFTMIELIIKKLLSNNMING